MTKEHIPKIVHYAWFGRGEKNELAQKCIDSWKKYLPNYEFIEWNEDNFNLNNYKYAKQAYEAKKYAHVTDVVRLHVLYEHGGIYMDTDVEVLKPLDPLLTNRAFSGFESDDRIPTGIIAAKKNNGWVFDQLKFYETANFLDENNNPILTTNVQYIINISLVKHGYIPNGQKQTLKYGMVMYPRDYFCPKSLETGKINCTDNTYTIHHFSGSWVPVNSKINRVLFRFARRIVGERISSKIIKLKKKYI